MAPSSTKSLAHFMHPPHRLTELTGNTPYHCDGCKISGTGTRFTCTICKFNLHDCCAKCPNKWVISTRTHPHQLSLFVHSPKFNLTQSCQICHNLIEGLAYQCKGCKYFVHPLCVSSVSGMSQDGVKDSKRVDPQNVVGLATDLAYEKVKEDGGHFPYGTSNASNGYEAHSSGIRTSRGDDHHHGGIFEAIIRGIGHMFEASSQ